jgi:hypothetical protein
MDEQPTCGKGLAANAALPAKVSEVLAAMAEVLENHRTALDRTDPASRDEDKAYDNLSRRFQTIARELKDAADAMVGSRDLPMGRHNMDVMRSAEPARRFGVLIEADAGLQALLEERAKQHQQLRDQAST